MIELSQLEHLLAFAEYGTLSKAAEALHTSQPALSRSMQKLEEELRVPIFERQKNKMVLNKNGELTVDYAKRVLNQANDMIERVRAFDRSQRTISIGSCAPAPLWSLTPLLANLCPNMAISSDMKNPELLVQGLRDGIYQFIILPEPLDEADIYCTKYEEEHLFLTLPPAHPLASYKTVNFKDIDGENLLLFSQIGFWHDMCIQKMPASHFIVQNERFSFEELVKNSALPAFASNLTSKDYDEAPNRISIPILDPEANVTYYCICLLKTKKEMANVIKAIEKHGIK